MRILNKLFTKNKLKNNIECVFKHSIACSAIKRPFFSQEILVEERIPPGSHEANNALLLCSIGESTLYFEYGGYTHRRKKFVPVEFTGYAPATRKFNVHILVCPIFGCVTSLYENGDNLGKENQKN